MGVVCSSPSNVQIVASSLRKASTSARDESDSYMADGDSHDTSMERNSGVVAASALRLYERNTLPLQHVDTSIPGANSLDVLSELEVGPNVHVVSPTRALTGRFRAKATAQQEDAGLQSPTKVPATASDPVAPWYMAALPAAVMRHRAASSSSSSQPQSRPMSHAASLKRTSEPCPSAAPCSSNETAPECPDPSLLAGFDTASQPALDSPQRKETTVQQSSSPAVPSLGITERLASINRSQAALRVDSGSLSGARTQRQYSINDSIQRTASLATDSAEVRSSLPPHFHLPTEQQNASALQHTVSSITMPHALSRPTSAAPIRKAFSAATEPDHPPVDYGPRSPDGSLRAQPPLDAAADAQNSNRPGYNSIPSQDARLLTRSRSATANFSRLAAQSFNRKVADDPVPPQAAAQVPIANPSHTSPVLNAIEDYCHSNTRPRSAESSSCRPSWTGSTPLQLPPGGVSRAGLGSACLILSQLPLGLSAETAAQRQLSSRGSGRAGSNGRAVSPSPSFLVSTQCSSTAQGASSPYAGNAFQKLPLLILPASGSNDGTYAVLSAREKSRSGSVTHPPLASWQPTTPTSAHAESGTPRSSTNDTHVTPFTVNGGNNDSSGSGSMSKSNKQPAYSPTSAAALLLAAAAFNGFGLPQQPQHPSSDSSSARVTAAEVAAAVSRQPVTSEIQLEPVQQVPYTPSLLEQQQQHLVLPPPAYLQAKRRASMPSTQLPKYPPSYAVDVARRQQQQSHLYREMDNVSSSNHIPLLEDEPSYCSTVANEAIVEDPGRVPPSWSMELEQDLLASLPPPQYHRRTCAATASGYVSDAMMEDRPRHWATDATAAAADEEAAARNAAGFEQRMFNLLPHAKYDRGPASSSSSGGGARSSAAAGGKSKSEKVGRGTAVSVSRPPIPVAGAMV